MTTKSSENSLRILIIDQDADAVRECRDDLKQWGYDVVVSHGHLQALTILDDLCIDLVLVRMEPTDIDGLEFCRLVRRRQREDGRQQVFLLLLGREEHRAMITEQNTDADDFLIEPFLKSELRWRLSAGLRSVSRQRRLNQFLQTDPDTGLLSREGLNLYLLEEVNRTSRKKGLLSLLLVRINDPDEAVRDFGRNWIRWLQDQLAGTIRRSLCNYDRLAGIGEGALCLVLAETGGEGAGRVAERLQTLFQGLSRQNPALTEVSLELQISVLTLQLEADFTGVRKGVELLWSWVDEQFLSEAPDRFTAGILTNDGIELNR
ncbi:MAG: response regulator [Desulfohalobiaceae bacterium]